MNRQMKHWVIHYKERNTLKASPVYKELLKFIRQVYLFIYISLVRHVAMIITGNVFPNFHKFSVHSQD